MHNGFKVKEKKKAAALLPGIFLSVILIVSGSMFFSCKSETLNQEPLTGFIYYAEENGLPVDYLKIINDKISIKYRARPAYSGGIVYLTDAFDDDGNLLPFYQMDSFEVSSIFHESFHVYVDFHIKAGAGSSEERKIFENIMDDALDYYTVTADGRKIVWGNYRKQSSEEAMAIQITDLIKYKIVYEKVAEKTARNYIHDSIDRDQMDRELLAVNRQWQEIYKGHRSRGYYNKSFLRWKFPHIIDVEKYISNQENMFVLKYILPGLDSSIEKPPLTEFIKESKIYGLPYSYLIAVNKNHFWEDGFSPGIFKEMSPEEISRVYMEAFIIYWEKILTRGASSKIYENETFSRLLEVTEKWYQDQITDLDRIEQISRNAAAAYIENIIREKIIWQNSLNSHLVNGSSFNTDEFKMSWRKAVEGKDVYGYYTENGRNVISGKPLSLDEKEFILDFILTDINYSFGSLITVEPVPADGEIRAESETWSGLSPDLQ